MTAPSIDAVSGLVLRLRAIAEDGDVSVNDSNTIASAADALEAQARELAEARALAQREIAEHGKSITAHGEDIDALATAEARIAALESDAREKGEAWAFDFVAAWHERQARLFRDMADDDPRTAKPARDRAKEAAIHHAASAAALRNRASDDRRTALSKGEPR